MVGLELSNRYCEVMKYYAHFAGLIGPSFTQYISVLISDFLFLSELSQFREDINIVVLACNFLELHVQYFGIKTFLKSSYYIVRIVWKKHGKRDYYTILYVDSLNVIRCTP